VPVEAMGQVAINVNGRLYRFDCGDGEEKRLQELAAYVKGRIESLVKEYGKVGDERLMLTAALLITDELLDARAQLAELTKPSVAPERSVQNIQNVQSQAYRGQAHQDQAQQGQAQQGQAQTRGPANTEPVEPEPDEIPRKVAGGEA
jgi:cell division protein ZapA